jgi:hypothetical protein
VYDAACVEFVEEALCHLIGAGVEADPVTDHEDTLVATHFFAQSEIQRLVVGHRRHVSRPHDSEGGEPRALASSTTRARFSSAGSRMEWVVVDRTEATDPSRPVTWRMAGSIAPWAA